MSLLHRLSIGVQTTSKTVTNNLFIKLSTLVLAPGIIVGMGYKYSDPYFRSLVSKCHVMSASGVLLLFDGIVFCYP